MKLLKPHSIRWHLLSSPWHCSKCDLGYTDKLRPKPQGEYEKRKVDASKTLLTSDSVTVFESQREGQFTSP